MMPLLDAIVACSLLLNPALTAANFSPLGQPQSGSGWPTEAAERNHHFCNSSTGFLSECPPGMFCENGRCSCGVYPNNLIKCNGTRTFIQDYNCLGYDDEKGIVVVGKCPQHFNNSQTLGSGGMLYRLIASDMHQLNNETCRTLNKTGFLCGTCLPDHYPLAYSFTTNCIPCPTANINWLWYIMAAYLPLTVFYFFILFFKVNTTHSHLLPLVIFCQALSMPIMYRAIDAEIRADYNTLLLRMAKVIFSFYGVWNLDFFRPLYSDLCLGIGILPTLALDYAVAVYPLVLITLTYFLITLYDRNYRVVRCAWSPFQRLLSLFRSNWNVKHSVVDVFATFFLFSNTKFLSVSFDFLIPTKVFRLYPDHYNYTLVLFYAGDVEYFGTEHLPYAILALAVLCVFVLLPVAILALYPFGFFHKFISLFPIRWHALHAFVDSFHGCYKDGTQPGTRDYRWCVSAIFILRFLQFLLYGVFETKLFYSVLITILLIMCTTLIACLRPYKQDSLNMVTVLFFNITATFSIIAFVVPTSEMYAQQYMVFFYVLGVICLTSGPLYLIAIVCRWVYMHKRFGFDVLVRLKAWQRGYVQLSGTAAEEALPDRLENSDNYHRGNLANFVSQQNRN